MITTATIMAHSFSLGASLSLPDNLMASLFREDLLVLAQVHELWIILTADVFVPESQVNFPLSMSCARPTHTGSVLKVRFCQLIYLGKITFVSKTFREDLRGIPYWRVIRRIRLYFYRKEICAYTWDVPNKERCFQCRYIENCSKIYVLNSEYVPISDMHLITCQYGISTKTEKIFSRYLPFKDDACGSIWMGKSSYMENYWSTTAWLSAKSWVPHMSSQFLVQIQMMYTINKLIKQLWELCCISLQNLSRYCLCCWLCCSFLHQAHQGSLDRVLRYLKNRNKQASITV